jgi:hypothetical protein
MAHESGSVGESAGVLGNCGPTGGLNKQRISGKYYRWQ